MDGKSKEHFIGILVRKMFLLMVLYHVQDTNVVEGQDVRIAVACHDSSHLIFNLDCKGAGYIFIINSTVTHSTCNQTAGCCVNEGDCTDTAPDQTMIRLNDCNGQNKCSETFEQAAPGLMPNCPGLAPTYQVVNYICVSDSTTGDVFPKTSIVTEAETLPITATSTNMYSTSGTELCTGTSISVTSPSSIETSPNPDGANVGLIAGAAAGLFLLILIILTTVCIIYQRRKKQNVQKSHTSDEANDYAEISDKPDIVKSTIQSNNHTGPVDDGYGEIQDYDGSPNQAITATEKKRKPNYKEMSMVINEDEYAVPNKPIAQAKAAARKQDKLQKGQVDGENTYAEAWNMQTGDRAEGTRSDYYNATDNGGYYNTKDLATNVKPARGKQSHAKRESDAYATVEDGASEECEGVQEDYGYSTVDFKTPGGDKARKDEDDDDVTLEDNPVYT